MQLESLLEDLSAKAPYMRRFLQPKYVPYFNTAGTVLLGWIIVCWISHLMWTLLGPALISGIAIILICPATASWCFKELGLNLDTVLNGTLEKFRNTLLGTS